MKRCAELKRRFSKAGLPVLLTFANAAAASELSFSPIADAFVTSGPAGSRANNNYGAAGALGVSAPGSAQGEFQSVLKFDLSVAASGFDVEFGAGQWAIQSASLTVTYANGGNALFNASKAGSVRASWMQNDSWTEGAGSPNAPTTSGLTFNALQNTFLSAGDENLGAFSLSPDVGQPVTITFDLTPGFAADIQGGNTVSIRLSAADNAVSAIVNSRSFTTPSSRPFLTVTAIPEPGTLALMAFGGVALAAAARRSVRR